MESTFDTGTLWNRIQQSARRALQCNALRPIATQQVILPEHGVDFLVRQVSSLARKHEDKHKHEQQSRREKSTPDNPFLPYETELFVADVSPNHICLLNKFNVIEHHVLIVTREFEHQDNLLTETDFAAWFRCMQEYKSLGFYNGGVVAGASQTHKHMQLIPLPLAQGGLDFPLLPLLQKASTDTGNILHCDLPFQHGVIALDKAQLQGPTAAAYLLDCYASLLAALGITPVNHNGQFRHSAPYNLLFTPQWMWLVPRSRECFDGISINALGYAGSLFVRDARQLEILRQAGPMSVLRSVSMPR
jgi:ATP adenylyltransferase